MELSLTMPMRFQAKKTPNIIDTIEKNYRISRRVDQSLLLMLQTVLLNIFIRYM